MKIKFLVLFFSVFYFITNKSFAQKDIILQEETDKTGKKIFFLKNSTGKTIKKFSQYDQIFSCENLKNRFVVMKNTQNNVKLYGLINEKGNEIIKCIYEDYNNTFALDQKIAYVRLGRYFLLKSQNKIGVLDANGKVILPFIYENIETLYHAGDGFPDEVKTIILQKNGFWDILDLQTKQPKNFDFGAFLGYWQTEYYTLKQYAIFEKQNKILFFDFISQSIAEKINDTENHISSIIIKKDNKFGVVNREGTLVIPLEYEEILPYQPEKYDVYKVRKNGKWEKLDIKK